MSRFQGKGKGFSIRNRGDINLERKVSDLMIKTYIKIINGDIEFIKFDSNLKKQYAEQLRLKNQSPVED
ncbi:hypothetical protein KY290_027389 [Solanum tuberosum]|uniref:Uncharacterized protein n=1 Tax=Solanum tuberosum TaxID=4113 RepID=A0ABQ7UEZ5_SOLTU|nr:hypothetical protein KY290_027389 [Solanum tuberosum]